MNRASSLALLWAVAGVPASAMATDMDVVFNGSGAHYVCSGASQVSVQVLAHPVWRWFCAGLVQNCSEDTLAANIVPAALGAVAPTVTLTCTELATNEADLMFRDGAE